MSEEDGTSTRQSEARELSSTSRVLRWINTGVVLLPVSRGILISISCRRLGPRIRIKSPRRRWITNNNRKAENIIGVQQFAVCVKKGRILLINSPVHVVQRGKGGQSVREKYNCVVIVTRAVIENGIRVLNSVSHTLSSPEWDSS